MGRVFTDQERQRRSDSLRQRLANPDFKAAVANASKERWADPEYAERVTKKRLKNLYAEPDNIAKIILPRERNEP